MGYYGGIDGGGTSTRAVIIDDDLRVLGRGTAEAGNHFKVGYEIAACNCAAAMEAAVSDASRIVTDFKREQVTGWGFGLAGVRRAENSTTMRTHLHPLVGETPWILDTDAAAAHAGAFAGGPGIVLIAGTGSICLGINEGLDRFYADGYGTLLGDEGSGYWMGVEALRAVCRAIDGRGPRTPLAAPVLDTLNLPDIDAAVQFVYSRDCAPEQIAQLARAVLDNATAGGAVAIEIRDRAVNHLANSVAAVARQYLNNEQARAGQKAAAHCDLQIALCGGLFEDDFFRASVGYQIGERMIEIKRDFLPLGSWRVIKPHHDAAVGAAILARPVIL